MGAKLDVMTQGGGDFTGASPLAVRGVRRPKAYGVGFVTEWGGLGAGRVGGSRKIGPGYPRETIHARPGP